MFYDNKRYFQIDVSKPTFAQWFAELNISQWVGAETLSVVNFKAKERESGTDVSTVVLDQVKCTYATNILKPFIQAGVEKTDYRISIECSTSEGSKEVFYIDFDVANG